MLTTDMSRWWVGILTLYRLSSAPKVRNGSLLPGNSSRSEQAGALYIRPNVGLSGTRVLLLGLLWCKRGAGNLS